MTRRSQDDFSGVLPDGVHTTDPKVYSKAWRKLGDIAESVFDGYQMCGFDPIIHLRCDANHLELSVHAVHALARGLEKLK